jgi:hypothetical protein
MKAFIPLSITLALAIAFELVTAQSLQALVASHFSAGGLANGFMVRGDYLLMITGMTLLMPLLLALIAASAHLLPPRYINLPQRDYWLAPERRADTIATFVRLSMQLAHLLAAFLCFIHWLVVHANTLQPPQFPETPFKIGAVLFLLALLAWLLRFFNAFRRPPQ